MKNENLCIITALVVGKTRSADNADTKRPVLDLEIITEENGEVYFEKIPGLLSGGALARSFSGIGVGNILVITGEVRMDANGELYVDIARFVCLKGKENRKVLASVAEARVDLMQYQMAPNFVQVAGVVLEKDDGEIKIKVDRTVLSIGDLTEADSIPVAVGYGELPDVAIGDRVIVSGQVSTDCLLAESFARLA